MAYGMKVFNGQGGVVMDTTTFTYQVIWKGEVNFTDTVTGTVKQINISIPGFNPANCVFVCIPFRPQDLNPLTIAHGAYPFIRVFNNQVQLFSNHPDYSLNTSQQTRALFKAYALRYGN